MIKLYIVVEGQTEEAFVNSVLGPHLQKSGLWVRPIVVETGRNESGGKARGGGRWKHWWNDLRRLTAGQRGVDVHFTTLVDLYALPADFPEIDIHRGLVDTKRRVSLLESAMKDAVGDHRLIPYIQRHEFEALVLAAFDSLERLLEGKDDQAHAAALKRALAHAAPEDVNDGKNTAPSKRLQAIPTYQKTLHGPLAIAEAGLPAVRARCPRFNEWVAKLEGLGTTQL